jgi:hypothetical protein
MKSGPSGRDGGAHPHDRSDVGDPAIQCGGRLSHLEPMPDYDVADPVYEE